MPAAKKIRIAILEDHQSIIDGYLHRLSQSPDIEVAGIAMFAEQLEAILAQTAPEVLILDILAPTSADNPNPYPILHDIPKWLQAYPNLTVLVISMLNRRQLVKAVLESGASGYILKDDQKSILELGNIIRLVAQGGVYLSQQVHHYLLKQAPNEPVLTPRQLEVLSLCSAYPDAHTAELAAKLGIAHSTLRNLLSGVYLRLGVHSRPAALAKAMQLGLLAPPDSIG